MTTNRHGLSTSDWALLNELAFTPLKSNHARVWIFGSRARGNYKKFSDIDILYEFTQSPTVNLIGSIEENLENSRLPIKVDLVQRKDVAESYKEQIEREKILVE